MRWSVVFGVTFRLLVINISSSSPTVITPPLTTSDKCHNLRDGGPAASYCRCGEEQSHKSPTPGGGPDEYRRAVKSILIYLENTSGI